MNATREEHQPAPLPKVVTVQLFLTAREADQLMSFMGLNLTVPPVVSGAGYAEVDVQKFMSRMFDALRNAGASRIYGEDSFRA